MRVRTDSGADPQPMSDTARDARPDPSPVPTPDERQDATPEPARSGPADLADLNLPEDPGTEAAGEVGDTRQADELRMGQLLIAGDHEAIDYCFRRWGKVIYSSALAALNDPGEADDVTQQVFIAAWRSRRDFDPARGSLPGWLFGIARHRILDRLRARRREQALVDRYATASDPHPAAESVVDRLVDHLVLVSELSALPDPRGTILRLSLWEGRSHSEIAAELGLPLGTVKSHARRGLLRLRDRMGAILR